MFIYETISIIDPTRNRYTLTHVEQHYIINRLINTTIPPTACAIYTMVYNLLDFPACVVPVTRETEEDQKLLEEYNPKDCLHQLLKEVCCEIFL